MTRYEEVFLEDFDVTDNLESKAKPFGNVNITALILVLALSFPKASVAQCLFCPNTEYRPLLTHPAKKESRYDS